MKATIIHYATKRQSTSVTSVSQLASKACQKHSNLFLCQLQITAKHAFVIARLQGLVNRKYADDRRWFSL